MSMVDEFTADLAALSDTNPQSMSLSNPRNFKIKEFLGLRFHAETFMPKICQRAACGDLKTADGLMAVKASSNAIVSLGLIGHASESRKEECISGLCGCLASACPILVGLAVSVLHSLDALGFPAVREATGQLMESSDARVRQGTAIALGEAKNSRAVPILIDLLRDADPSVCNRAKDALIKYKGGGFFFGSANAEKWEKWWENTPELHNSR